MTSAVWLPNIASFSKEYRCYAIDVIGDYGKSELSNIKNFPRVGKDYSIWLREVLDKAGIEKGHLMGFSHGWFVAINHAIYASDQINKLILLAHSGFDITLKKVLPKIFYFLLFPTKNNRDSLVRWFLSDNPNLWEAYYEQFQLGLQGRPKVPIPILATGKKLRMITNPLMVILGENDVAISADRSRKRLAEYIPSAHTVVMHGSGHAMIYEGADQVNQLVLDFLGS